MLSTQWTTRPNGPYVNSRVMLAFCCFLFMINLIFSITGKLWNESWVQPEDSQEKAEVADKAYKKSHLGNEWKKPFAGSSHAKGIVLVKMDSLVLPSIFLHKTPLQFSLTDVQFIELRKCFCSGIEAKQPNSAIRKRARVKLIKNGKKIAAYIPSDSCLNFTRENCENPNTSVFCDFFFAV